MKFKWLQKRGGKDAAVFFGGFACAENLLDGLALPKCDVCLVYGYGDFELGESFAEYQNLYVCAWSFGVKVADAVTAKMGNVRLRVAICGTNAPVDAAAGIPPEVFAKSVENFESAGGKFFRRICGGDLALLGGMAAGDYRAAAAELAGFAKFFEANPKPACRWDFAFACKSDTVFTPRALENAFGRVSVWEGAHLNKKLFEYALNIPFDPGRVCAAFERQAGIYDKSAVVQRNVGLYLRERLCEMFAGRTFELAFEFGCGTGFLTSQIMRHLSCKKYVLSDFSLRLCGEAAKRLGAEFNAGPVEEIAPCAADLILSASCLQWVRGRAGVYKKLFKAARGGAVAALASFGADNFCELSQMGFAPVKYDTPDVFRGEVSAAGFEILYSAAEKFSFLLPSPRDVLRHIKNTGVNGSAASFWTPQKFARFDAEYREKFSDFGGVRLTYNPMYIIARKKP